jgi:phosphatidylglycerol---prolipoprotein diacylglyceryl transferase
MLPGINLGPLTIRYYGLIIMFGALMGAWLASREAKRRSLDPEIVWDGLIWILFGGIIGARLWHVILPSTRDMVVNSVSGQLVNPYYFDGKLQILDILAIWRGGLGIPGAILGGGIALFIFCRRRGQRFAIWADVAAPGIALAQAIGRWGNFVNQELYGRPTGLPWGIKINFPTNFPPETRFHPLFFYESIWNLANMTLCLVLSRKYGDKLKPGDIFLVFLIFYATGRFFLEFLRLDIAQVGGVNANQTIAGIIAISCGLILVFRHVHLSRSRINNA